MNTRNKTRRWTTLKNSPLDDIRPDSGGLAHYLDTFSTTTHKRGNNMTPEERFERIEKTLDRIASEAAARSQEMKLDRVVNDNTLRRIERSQEFIVESHAQLTTDMSSVMTMIVKLVDTINGLAELYRRHIKDNHGPESEGQE